MILKFYNEWDKEGTSQDGPQNATMSFQLSSLLEFVDRGKDLTAKVKLGGITFWFMLWKGLWKIPL